MPPTIPPTKEEGVVYVSSTGDYFESPKIDSEKIKDFSQNPYGKGAIEKLINLIFSEKYEIKCIAEDGNEYEEGSKNLSSMTKQKDVRLWANMKKAFRDRFLWGMAVYNQVWEYEGNLYVLKKLRHLPGYSFRNLPVGNIEQYSDFMKGIVLNDKNVMEFWQVQDSDSEIPVKLDDKNIFWVRDPSDDGLTGESLIAPMIPILERLNFTWNAQMQQTNRTGAKILFIKVTNPQPASSKNGSVSDITYANTILENWGKNTAFQLRENMELIDPGIKDDASNLDVITALTNMLIDYISPVTFLSTDQTTRLGGSDSAREELLYKYIQGIHGWISDQFEMLLQKYLDVNYPGKNYTVQVEIQSPTVDRTKLNLEQAKEAIKGQLADANELREKLEFEHADDEKLDAIREFWESKPAAGGEFGFMVQRSPSNADIKTKNETEDNLDTITERMAKGILTALENEE